METSSDPLLDLPDALPGDAMTLADHGQGGSGTEDVELAYTPFYGSWLNRIETQFTALRHFAPDGTDHPSHAEQGRAVRRYTAWRTRNARDRALRKLVKRAECCLTRH